MHIRMLVTTTIYTEIHNYCIYYNTISVTEYFHLVVDVLKKYVPIISNTEE
jgi:hypothetical protein